MYNLWDFEVWGFIILLGILLFSLLLANLLKKSIRFLRNSLIPTSVLGGIILLIFSTVYYFITDKYVFESEIFNGNGHNILEAITYHCLGLGFIAMTMKNNTKKFDKKRSGEIFDTGVTTVSTYLIQAVFGLGITIGIGFLVPTLFKASGIILPFGYGQGTGQAFNYGTIYEQDYGFVGGANFGLTIAALGFLSASIGGVIYLNVLRKKNKIGDIITETAEKYNSDDIQTEDEIAMNGSMDKLTMQIAIVISIYILTYILMFILGSLIPSLKAVLFGFNFLFGVLIASIVKKTLQVLKKKNVVKKQYVNTFLMTRISGFAFDLMIIAGIATIKVNLIINYWYVLLILGLVGAIITFVYVKFVCNKLFKDYKYEQFFAMYGMLTGTASTGIILLREIDPEFKTPAADNLVYQNFPAIVFGFPMMLIAAFAPKSDNATYMTFAVVLLFFIAMNVILFRRQIFKRKNN